MEVFWKMMHCRKWKKFEETFKIRYAIVVTIIMFSSKYEYISTEATRTEKAYSSSYEVQDSRNLSVMSGCHMTVTSTVKQPSLTPPANECLNYHCINISLVNQNVMHWTLSSRLCANVNCNGKSWGDRPECPQKKERRHVAMKYGFMGNKEVWS